MDIATLSTFLSSLIQFIVGVRLLLLARKTLALPEFIIGIAMFLIGTGKATDLICLAIFGETTSSADMAAKLQFALSHFLFYYVWYIVFRHKIWWARFLYIAAGLILAYGYVYQVYSGWQFDSTVWGTNFNLLRLYVAIVGFTWGTIECFIYYYRLKKQIRFGLASSSTAIRVFLWGCVMAANTLLVVAIYATRELHIISDSSLAVFWPAINLFSGICWWFSFLTPAFLVRRLDRMADSSEGV